MKLVESRKILVVDDEEDQRRVFCRRLSLEGFEVFASDSGLDAIARVQELHPDLVLADIGMPKIDGVQVLKIMRSAPQTATIPVILMTAMPIPASVLQAAADGLHAGPIHVKDNFQALLDRINNIFDRSLVPADEPGPDVRLFHRGMISVNVMHRDVIVAGRRLPRLSAKRFDLLLALLRHAGPVDQNVLLRDVWGHRGDLKLVQITILRLREDLRNFPALQIKTEAPGYELVVSSLPANPND
jgi:DNA-binding response OmpR family regulator